MIPRRRSHSVQGVEDGTLEEMRLRLVDEAKRVMIANQVPGGSPDGPRMVPARQKNGQGYQL